MGIVWEAYHKGVPLLGVPEITLECSRLPHQQLNLTPHESHNHWLQKSKRKEKTTNKHKTCASKHPRGGFKHVYFDWGNDPIWLIFFRWVVQFNHQNIGIHDVYFFHFFPKAVMLQIMASFVMAIMTACALMWASGAMERKMGRLERLGLGKDVCLGYVLI